MRTSHVLLIGGVAVAAYVFGPQLRANLMPFLGSFRGFTMRLDPSEMSPVEDRRGEHRGGLGRGGPWDDLSGFADGGDIGRMPGPRGGPGGGMDPWGDGRGEAGPGGGFPGGGGGGGLRCRDRLTGQDVPMSFCERERMGRR
jgi:hypothetical protein